ncbi:hypothetical protein GCM10018980_51150 [Streptomyces capoamus]|uniref:Uncharacterized protein n=1 Tax=Streptomyces capoamus TaxID=68183 RepID=A0A919KE02_9ACTN|nr:hypothetical protein [Streptomyces capoamus]GGW15868.1 hypothetical protein GCM10010501_29660 [Streptomyces libani subsp. rufus]GHG61755.1 hypothetical protein GCM10018980_51150 [Streptomyces capoamus]
MATSSQTPTSFRARQDARERNEHSYQTTCVVQELPQSTHIAVQATESAVLVTATNIDVLAEWLHVMHGTVTRTDLPSGQTAWTLRTQTWTDSPAFPPVPVFVTVVLPSDEPVMHEIAEAVAA